MINLTHKCLSKLDSKFLEKMQYDHMVFTSEFGIEIHKHKKYSKYRFLITFCEDDELFDRYLIAKVPTDKVQELIHGKVSHLDCLMTVDAGRFFIVDYDRSMPKYISDKYAFTKNIADIWVVSKENCPSEYLPKPNIFVK
jgi:hypothetical protein